MCFKINYDLQNMYVSGTYKIFVNMCVWIRTYTYNIFTYFYLFQIPYWNICVNAIIFFQLRSHWKDLKYLGITGKKNTNSNLVSCSFYAYFDRGLFCLARKRVKYLRNHIFYHRAKGENPERKKNIKITNKKLHQRKQDLYVLPSGGLSLIISFSSCFDS